jgi:hypothetical protein
MRPPETDLFGAPVQPPPKRGANGYAAPPGSGPAGKTCRDCAAYVSVQHNTRRYPKCARMRAHWTRGPGSDIKAASPACRLFEAARAGAAGSADTAAPGEAAVLHRQDRRAGTGGNAP